jgi:hypothetical protein
VSCLGLGLTNIWWAEEWMHDEIHKWF